MDFLFLLFIFLASVGIVGGAYFFYSGGRHMTAFILFGGFLALTVLYGLRWFRNDGSLNQSSVAAWPPVINVCPDFLSLTAIGGRAVCVDTVGVAPNGGIQKNDGTQTSPNSIFDLQADTTDSSARTALLCQQCQSMMVTWEGVFDGSSCIGGEPPYPPVPGTSSLSVTETTRKNVSISAPGSLVSQ
jgi:hypothetical protein